MTDDYKSETKFKVESKSETEEDLEDAGDKIKAGAKAAANKIKNPHKDLGTEYEKEKVKEKID